MRLEHVSFSYPARPGRVLDGIDLELSPGQTVALVGKSGSGKSTLAALLLRLVDPTEGRIVIGSADIASCEVAEWRRHLAWVPQQPTLLRDTVAGNIRLGAPFASDDSVRAAAVQAGAHDFIEGLPHGYETIVGDGGRPVSTGERRRIALARAFLRDSPLVILDEPTADLDPASAALIAEAVGRLREGRTVLLIAHRSELVDVADRVVVLEAGKVAA